MNTHQLLIGLSLGLILSGCEPVERPHLETFPLDSLSPHAATLTPTLPESSGLIRFNEQLWLLNDSGDGPYLYVADQVSGDLIRKITISGAENQDWESLTQDSLYVYIGDTGNNGGSREDLRIYRVSKAALRSGSGTVEADIISYAFSEQKSFHNRKHPFDCEAIVVEGDSIFLFTKNRNNPWSYLYAFSKQPGQYTISRMDSFLVQGMITDAYWDPPQKRLYLLGYNLIKGNFFPFLWEWNDLDEPGFNATGKRRNLAPNVQAEAMSGTPQPDSLLINTEEGNPGSPQLFNWYRPSGQTAQ